MLFRIISQDKMADIPYSDALKVSERNVEGRIYHTIDAVIEGGRRTIAAYDTCERAVKVMDELRNAYWNFIIDNGSGEAPRKYPPYYQMPAE